VLTPPALELSGSWAIEAKEENVTIFLVERVVIIDYI
jgi:hypothetical protein